MASEPHHDIYSRDATVYVVKGEDKLATFSQAVGASDFVRHLLDHWEASGVPKDEFRIAIKPNIMTASLREEDSPVYTDPALVEELVRLVRDEGFKRLYVVESQNVYDYSYQKRTVLAVAEMCGYTRYGYQIVNLSEDTVEFDYGGTLGTHRAGRVWVEADYRISFAKNKTHWQCFYTACIKNVYGCLPEWDKMKHYHGKGIEFFEAAVLCADRLPVHFGFMDAWTSGDGFAGHVRDPEPNQTRTIFASDNIYALDWIAGRKMQINPADNYVIQEAIKRWGLFKRIIVVGDMKAWYPWRNVRPYVVKSLNVMEEYYWMSRFFSRALASEQDGRFPPVKRWQWFFGILQTLSGILTRLTTTKTDELLADIEIL